MHELVQKVADLQGLGLILAGAALLIGLLLWVSGRRMLRTAFGATGVLAGAVAGLALSELPAVAELAIPPWVIALVGAVVVGMVAAAAYRLALAASIALLLGALAPLGALAAAEHGLIKVGNDQAVVTQQPLASSEIVENVLGESVPPPAAETEPAAQTPTSPAAEDLQRQPQWLSSIGEAVVEAPRRTWEQAPEPLRWVLLASAGVGALLGLVLGAAAPSFSASLVTALAGSLLLIGGSWTFAMKLNVSERFMPQTMLQWVAWWGIAAIIGLGLQWIFRAKPADM